MRFHELRKPTANHFTSTRVALPVDSGPRPSRGESSCHRLPRLASHPPLQRGVRPRCLYVNNFEQLTNNLGFSSVYEYMGFLFRIRSAFGTDGGSSFLSQTSAKGRGGRLKGIQIPKGTPGDAKKFLVVVEGEFRRRMSDGRTKSSDARNFTQETLLQLAVPNLLPIINLCFFIVICPLLTPLFFTL